MQSEVIQGDCRKAKSPKSNFQQQNKEIRLSLTNFHGLNCLLK